MKFSVQQFLLILLSLGFIVLAVLRFVYLGEESFSFTCALGMVLVALCGLLGAWKLDDHVRRFMSFPNLLSQVVFKLYC